MRPAYPAIVFDDLAGLGGLPAGGRVLEIGPGTGKATVELARRNLGPFPRTEVAVSDFETWEPEQADFDAVAAFTAFHWIASEIRFEKAARLLRPGGALGVAAAHHVTPADADPVWAETQADYDAVLPHPDNRPPLPPEDAPDLRAEMLASGRFDEVAVRSRRWDVTYAADEWIAVLGTYSDNLALPPALRGELLRGIHARIAARPGGRATRHYLAVLTLGRRS